MKNFDKLPKEIQEKILEYQEKQTGKRNPQIFKDVYVTKDDGGFNWCDTPDGIDFWLNVLLYNNYDVFFEKYPKKENTKPFPKFMRVSDEPINNKNKGYLNFVIGKIGNKFIVDPTLRPLHVLRDFKNKYEYKSTIDSQRIIIWNDAIDVDQEEIFEILNEELIKIINDKLNNL